MLRARVWKFASPQLCISSAPVGGGIGTRSWALNVQVKRDYARTDLDAHIAEIAASHECRGDGVGMLTAASLDRAVETSEAGIAVYATVGLALPTWAASHEDVLAWRPGTINVVAFLPVRLSDAALVNAVMTITEAKAQALFEANVSGTGTASDAICVVCPPNGEAEPFSGPRSNIGAPLARAVHAAVLQGATQ